MAESAPRRPVAVEGLIGQTFDAVSSSELVRGARIKVEQIEDEVYWTARRRGMSFVGTVEGIVNTVQLTPSGLLRGGFLGELPLGLSFAEGRAAVRARLGSPARAGDSTTVPVLGSMPPWDRYDFDDVAIHIEYQPGGHGIRSVSIMDLEWAPRPLDPSEVERPAPRVTTWIEVPGPWQDPGELGQALMDDGIVFPPGSIVATGTPEDVVVALQGRDDGMVEAFRAAGTHSTLTEDDYRRIGAHRSRCQVSDFFGGSVDAATRLARLAVELLRAGGFGVKVEPAPRAHAPIDWMGLFEGDFGEAELVDGFVAWVGDPIGGATSCGMHNLGLPEAAVPDRLAPAAAVSLLRSFCLYQALEKPELRNGQTFATGPGEPEYVLSHSPSPHVPFTSLWNEQGVWTLAPSRGSAQLG
jgi:hypothetical protein